MKLYITARYKGSAENKDNIEQLCSAVRDSGMEDFCFIRDVENYQKVFNNPKDLWERSLAEMRKCDAMLIDVSDAPTGGRVVEAGIAYALNQPIFVIVKKGVQYKEVFAGLATKVIEYTKYTDITPPLVDYLRSAGSNS